MSEVEKLYSLTGIEKFSFCCDKSCGEPTKNAKIAPDYREIYPPFTAEKQLELIKWLASRILAIRIGKFKGKYYFGDGNFNSNENNFEEALATRINDLWNILSEEERKQIKEILE